MSKTTEKLSEAEFFLKQVEANYLENPAFDYFLSAFISSTRSVLWIMRSDYNDIEGWESWHQSFRPSIDIEALWQKVNAARIRTEKRAPIKTNFRVSIIIPKEQITEKLQRELENFTNKSLEVSAIPLSDQPTSVVLRSNASLVNFVGKIENVYRVLDELDDDDVLGACKKYYETIKEVVAECEKLFGRKEN